jgi:transcriptional regulator with PAS, ATPase and Fis domain
VEVNCAAIPGVLIVSELSGTKRSFNSAIRQIRKVRAGEGTLLLDEIGICHLSPGKSIGMLQEKPFTRVGSDNDISVK